MPLRELRLNPTRLSSALALVAALGCGRPTEREARPALGWLILDPDAELAAAPPPVIRSSPAGLVREAVRSGGALMVGIDASATGGLLRLEIDGACPVSLGLGEIADAARAGAGKLPPRRPLRAHVAVIEPPGAAQLGFGARFVVQVSAGCPDPSASASASASASEREAALPTIVWTQIGGPALPELTPSDDGRRVEGRMPTFAAVVPGPMPWGVVPLSPRTRGEVVLEARWTESGGRTLRREVRLAAAARARGLANTPVGARIFLGGQGWHLIARPDGSRAALDGSGGEETLASLLPDVAGTWQLADGGGRRLQLLSARYDQTLLDCGRSGCHAPVAEAASRSPMSSVLARGLAGGWGAESGAANGARYPACAIACHAVGEPGLADGGFSELAAELGWNAGGRWQDLPRPLRRAGGVGCLACHGPGAIPEAASRGAILRADVCAVCHDAPPRYGHVVAWGRTAMARADHDPRTRSEEACARCHTTAGFLASSFLTGAAANPGAPAPGHAAGAIDPASGAGASAGIACAACHAVHDHQTRAAPGAAPTALLRAPATPEFLAGASADGLERSAICLGCHAPVGDAASPAASAAALWLGRGGLEPRSGRPLGDAAGAAPHARVAGGCVGCHRGGPPALARGAGHSFEATPATCIPCHAKEAATADASVRERARRLWTAWLGRSGARTRADGAPEGATVVHAGPRPPRIDRSSPLGRAGWDLLLVLEDPAAAQHNAPYARALLAAAEEIIGAAPSPASPTTRTARRGAR